MAGLEVAGRRFRTEADYRAGLRDQARIEKIRAQGSMEQPGEVISLYMDIQSGKYRFETVVGNDFDDEIYELAQNYKRQGYTRDSVLTEEKKKKSVRITRSFAKKKPSAGPEHEKGRVQKSSSAEVSLDSYDEKMQQEILLEFKKRERRRRLTVVLCSVVA